MDNSLAELGDRLRSLRARHGLTQEEFAQLAGIGYKFYQDIEGARKKEIWLSTVERLAAPYGLRAWQLLTPDMPEDSKLTRKAPSSRVHRG
ncbi:helix-turn-helix domain-containing protein [Ruficoccus sp. ZRK36]|nr:helix-turn-helix domain-containing protein [Ruficoccus sp. ZRK36]